MSEQSEGQRSPQQEQTYVVQMLQKVEAVVSWRQDVANDGDPLPNTEAVYYWDDIATVTVPPRTKRSVVIKRALAEAGIVPRDGEQPRVRALDVDSAHVYEPEAHQPAPEWKIT